MSGEKRGITILLAVVMTALGIALLLLFPQSEEMRWGVAFVVFLLGFLILQLVKDKETLLIRTMVFLLPFRIGFLYTGAIAKDLIYSYDVMVILLYVYWFLSTNGLRRVKLYWGKATTPALMHIVWSGFSVIMAISYQSCILGVLLLFKGFLIYFYIVNRVVSKKQILALVTMIYCIYFIKYTCIAIYY